MTRAIIALAILAAGLVYGLSLLVGSGFQMIDEALDQREALHQRLATSNHMTGGSQPATAQAAEPVTQTEAAQSAPPLQEVDLPQVGTDYNTIIRSFGLPEHTELRSPFAWYTYRRFVICVRIKDGVIVAVSGRPQSRTDVPRISASP